MKRTQIYIADEKGNSFDALKDYKNAGAMRNIAEKRTHRFCLDMMRNGSQVTIKDALAAAYMQGMSDTALVL